MNLKNIEPQMNADERRYLTATDFSKIIHRKGRKECKAVRNEPPCPLYSPWLNTVSAHAHERTPQQIHRTLITRIGRIFTDTFNRCAVSSAQHSEPQMKDERGFVKNEDAVSITVGFILMFSITVIVFSTIVLSFYLLTQQSEKTSMRESFETLGNGLALSLTAIDMLANTTGHYSGTANTLEYDFSIPSTIANEGYSINFTADQIILEADNGAKAWIPFNTSSSVEGKTIYSNAEDFKFIYNSTDNAIRISEQ